MNQEDIDKLECHFKWNPQDGDIEANPRRNVDHLYKNIDEFPDIKLIKLALIGYLYAVDSPPQLTKAISVFDDIIDCCKKPPMGHDEEYKGYEAVSQYNKVNILLLLEKQDEAEELYKICPNYEDLHEKSRASMYGCHAYALSLHGKLKYQKSISMYQKAIDLDPENYSWHVGFAYVAGKNRRCSEGIQSTPTSYEESCLQKANELTSETKSFPLILLADMYFLKCRDFDDKGIPKDGELKEKAKTLYEKAMELAPNSVHILKRSGKAFHILGDEDRGLACLLKAIDLNPDCSQTLHRLGQIYEHGKTTKDYKKAELYYSKAVSAGIRRNFLAECDLARVRKKQDVTYDLRKHYEDMKDHYLDDEKKLDLLESNIKLAEENYRQYLKRSIGDRGRGDTDRGSRYRGNRGRGSEGRGDTDRGSRGRGNRGIGGEGRGNASYGLGGVGRGDTDRGNRGRGSRGRGGRDRGSRGRGVDADRNCSTKSIENEETQTESVKEADFKEQSNVEENIKENVNVDVKENAN